MEASASAAAAVVPPSPATPPADAAAAAHEVAADASAVEGEGKLNWLRICCLNADPNCFTLFWGSNATIPMESNEPLNRRFVLREHVPFSNSTLTRQTASGAMSAAAAATPTTTWC